MRIALRGIPALLALFPTGALAAEYSIRADGLGDYATIQAGVDSAAVGDTLVLEDGTFTGAGNRDVQFFGKDLVVRSRNGPTAVTIDSQGAPGDPHRAFRLSNGETQASRIEGLTIIGGFVEGVFPENGGGGILVEYGTHPVITDCVFDGNEAGFQGFGAGLLTWEDCDITLTDCVFKNGESGWYGGGFVLRKNCDALVERVTVIDNHSIHAGGGASITRSNAILNDCLFANNSTDEADGGGLLIKAAAEPVLTRCVFINNVAYLGGAIGLGNDPIVNVFDSLFEGNSATFGGAICLDQCPSTITFTNCTFAINTATSGARHIYNGPNATCTVRNSILDNVCGPGTSLWNTSTATLDIDCCVLPGGIAEILNSAGGVLTYGADNVDADPMFCGPDVCGAPAPSGNYTIDTLSPASSSLNSCGLVGAFPAACGATGVGGTLEERSWGVVKALHSHGAR